MLARDLMTTDVVSVSPDTPVTEIARRLLRAGISAVPVVDAADRPVGMVSEGDLIGRDEADREARRDWWLALLAEGEALHPDFLKTLQRPRKVASDVMAAPVVRVTETAEASEIARLLKQYRIKRVPVVRDDRIVGIVSRADLLDAVAGEREAVRPENHDEHQGVIAGLLTALGDSLGHHDTLSRELRRPAPTVVDDTVTAKAFCCLAADFAHHKADQEAAARHAAVEHRREVIREMIDLHFTDDGWRSLLHRAHEAAAHGEKEFQLLRFPSGLCVDRGRAVNSGLPDWPKTLRGEAAEAYLRWERDLKPHGFSLIPRILDFPDGKPGDIGLFLVWGY